MRRVSRIALLAASLTALRTPLAARTATPRYGSWGWDETLMDTRVRPGDNFFGYALGTWLKDAPIALDKARTGYNYDLPHEIERDVRTIVETAQKQRDARPFVRQIVAYYGARMDEAGIEARGTAPLVPYFARIAGARDRQALFDLMAEPAFASPIGVGITQDDKNPTRYAVEIGQARLGLPSRDYYLLSGAKYVAIRIAYRGYIVRILRLAGMTDAAAKADRIVALEAQLA